MRVCANCTERWALQIEEGPAEPGTCVLCGAFGGTCRLITAAELQIRKQQVDSDVAAVTLLRGLIEAGRTARVVVELNAGVPVRVSVLPLGAAKVAS